jgi:hypothetical protein
MYRELLTNVKGVQHWNAIKILQGIVPSNNVALEEALPLTPVLEAAAPFGITA